jgi:hypothetical protein
MDRLGLRAMPVSCQPPSVSQWAEMHRISWGASGRFSSSVPIACQVRRHVLSSMAFIGLPWPTNSTGIRGEGFSAWSSGWTAASES